MTTTYESTPYCASNLPVLRCAPRDEIGTRPRLTGITTAHPDVHLIPCNPPQGSLEQAPRTSLRPPARRLSDSGQERWEGFWCVDDERYYTRCVRADLSEEWYRIHDSGTAKVLRFRRSMFVSVRGASYVAANAAGRGARKAQLTQDAPPGAREAGGLTQGGRRTVLLGRYGQRSLLVRMSRSPRRTGGGR
jgi:hypothetical protein